MHSAAMLPRGFPRVWDALTSAHSTSASFTHSVENDHKQKRFPSLGKPQSEDGGSRIQTEYRVLGLHLLLRSMSSMSSTAADCLSSAFSCWNSTAGGDAANREVTRMLFFKQASNSEVFTLRSGFRSLFGWLVDATGTCWSCMPASGPAAVGDNETTLDNVTNDQLRVIWLNHVEEDEPVVVSTFKNQLGTALVVGIDNNEPKLEHVTNDQLRVIRLHPVDDEECVSTFSNQVGMDSAYFIAVQRSDQNLDIDIERVASSAESSVELPGGAVEEMITVNLGDRPGKPSAAQLGGLSLLGYKRVVFSICPALLAVEYEF